MIFESPDGGHTVYGRYPGEIEKTLISISPEKARVESMRTRLKLWAKILDAAENNVALSDLIKKTEEVYALIK